MADRPFALVVGGVDPRQLAVVHEAVRCCDLDVVWIADLDSWPSSSSSSSSSGDGSAGEPGVSPDHLVRLAEPVAAAEAIAHWLGDRAPQVVLPVDGRAAVAAGFAAALLEPADGCCAPAEIVARARDRVAIRTAWFNHGVPHAEYRVLRPGDDAAHVARLVGLPCMIAPVERLDDVCAFIDGDLEAPAAVEAIRSILSDRIQAEAPVLIERQVGGRAVIVWGACGSAGFDARTVVEVAELAADPLGDRMVLAPPRLTSTERPEVDRVAADAVAALGLVAGAVAVSLCVRNELVRVLDVEVGLAPRCLLAALGPMLKASHLAELVAGGDTGGAASTPTGAVGVLEIRRLPPADRLPLHGLNRARDVPGVTEVTEVGRAADHVARDARAMARVVARGQSTDQVEAALVAARAEISTAN